MSYHQKASLARSLTPESRAAQRQIDLSRNLFALPTLQPYIYICSPPCYYPLMMKHDVSRRSTVTRPPPDFQWNEVVAVTGTIGSGKSTALHILEEFGAYCVSADTLAREAVAPGSDALEAIRSRFGSEVLTDSDVLNRSALGRIVFNDAGARKDLEAILHPRVRARAIELFTLAKEEGKQALVYEVPLLFETSMQELGFKSIVLIAASHDACVARIEQRDNLSRDEVDARIRAQLPIEKKKMLSDVVIDNSGSVERLREQLARFWQSLV